MAQMDALVIDRRNAERELAGRLIAALRQESDDRGFIALADAEAVVRAVLETGGDDARQPQA